MEKLLRINDVMVFEDENTIERILWISPTYSSIFSIDLESSKLKINHRQVDDIERKIDDGKIHFNNEDYKTKMIPFDAMSPKESALLEDAWKIIQLIALDNNEPDIYISKCRNDLIKKASIELNVCKSTIYKYLKKYWTGGKLKITLLSELRKCGGKYKSRNSNKKLGRPREDTDNQGRNITERDRDIFQKSLKKYRQPGGKVSLRKVYDLMIAEYYTKYEIIDGEILIDDKNSTIPSFEQLRNWYYSPNRNIERILINEKGEKDYLLNHAPNKSNSKYSTFGPGYRYEIDSTTPPIYLTNRIMPGREAFGKHKNVGRPTVSLVGDVFSTLITGVHIDLSNASWEHATSALYNCTRNKVEFCKLFNLKIKEEQWPITYLPRKLLADNGELGGKLPEQLTESLNIEVENTRTYMGRDKGFIEGQFRKIEAEIISMIPGAIKSGIRKRGERDYRKDAVLDIEEFTRIVLRVIVWHNNSELGNYPMLEGMIKDNLHPTPINIWNWGMNNLSGHAAVYDDSYIKLSLMRKGVATVTESGIEFIERKYYCEIGNEEEWFIRAKNKGKWKVDIRYDKRNMNKIYIVDSGGERFITCHLKQEEEAFFDKHYDEIVDYIDYKKKQDKLYEIDQKNITNEMNIGIIHDVKEAQKSVSTDRSKKNMISNIQENQKLESNEYGLSQALIIEQKGSDHIDTEKASIDNNKHDDARDYIFDMLMNS